jgi:hypothetical protein
LTSEQSNLIAPNREIELFASTQQRNPNRLLFFVVSEVC